MRMKKENIDEVLLLRIIENRANDAEKELFEEWLNSSDNNAELFAQLKRAHQVSSFDIHSTQANWKRVVDKVRAGYTVPDYIELPGSQAAVKKIGIGMLWRVAAVVVLFFGLAFLLKNIDFDPEQLVSGKDLKNNEPYQLVDGSLVYLRSNSEIHFSKSFGRKNRKISLNGEAFFEVIADSELPFEISANKTTTRVVGTSFNVQSSPDGKVQVTVVTGVVDFSSGKSEVFYLHEGEQGTFNPLTARIEKTVVSDPNFQAWKTGLVVFKDTPLSEVLEFLGQLYSKTFIFEGGKVRMPTITTTFDNQPLETVLEELNLLLNTKNEIINGTIFFKPNR